MDIEAYLQEVFAHWETIDDSTQGLQEEAKNEIYISKYIVKYGENDNELTFKFDTEFNSEVKEEFLSKFKSQNKEIFKIDASMISEKDMINFLLFLFNIKDELKGLKYLNFGKRKFKNFEFSLFYKFILTNFSKCQEKYKVSLKDFWAKPYKKTYPIEKIVTSKKSVESK